MKQTVSEHDFREAFRSIRPDNFSYEGLGAMFEYMEQLEDDLGEEIELDVIAICCDFSEYTLDEIKSEYDYIINKDMDDDEIIEELQQHTTVIQVDDETFILQTF